MPDAPKVSSTTQELVAALTEGGFQYALIGGVAVIMNGYDRFTQDVDAVVWDLDNRLNELIALLERHGFTFRIPEGERDARKIRVLRLKSKLGVHVDLSMGFLPFEREVIEKAQSFLLPNHAEARTARVEDLIIMKLVASRDRDLDDITRLLELHPSQNKKRIRRIVSEYAELLENPLIIRNLKDRVK